MGQGVFDFFAAAGFGISGILLNGVIQNWGWLWLVLALAGLIWSIGMSALDEEGVLIFLKQLFCILLSAICVFANVKVDLAQYSYLAPGKLEAQLGRTQGAAMLPVYPVFLFGRYAMVDGRQLLSKGATTSVPNVVMQADLLTTDEQTLDDPQLKANLAIWNQIVAPYILKQDPAVEAALGQAGVLPTFMVPMPSSRQFVGTTADQAAKVKEILAGSKIGVADMLCTLQTYIETAAGRLGGAMWTSENGMCIDPNIRIVVASPAKDASSMPKFFNRPPQAAWDQGQALIASMSAASGVSSKVQTIGSLAELYEKIGQSTLLVAANNYANDSDKVVLLGTACDKMSTSIEPSACAITQSGLTSAASGVAASAGTSVQPVKQGFWGSIGSGFAFAGGWVVTSVFRIVIAMLSAMTTTVIPYAIGIGMTCALLVSVIGAFLLLWPKRFSTAMEWMIGPVLFVSLWAVLHNIWTEVDTWIMLLVAQIGSIVSEDRTMGSNVAGIICSLGYLGMPYLAYTILFGSVGNAIAKTTGLANTAVKAGSIISLALARMAGQIAGSVANASGVGALSNLSGVGGGGGGGGGGHPPASSPAGSVGGAGGGHRGSGGSSPASSPTSGPSQAPQSGSPAGYGVPPSNSGTPRSASMSGANQPTTSSNSAPPSSSSPSTSKFNPLP